MRYAYLCSFYFVYFIMTGMSTFIPKYYGEIGMSNSQIGILASIPTLMVFRDGKLHKQAVGFRSKEELLRLLEG